MVWGAQPSWYLHGLVTQHRHWWAGEQGRKHVATSTCRCDNTQGPPLFDTVLRSPDTQVSTLPAQRYYRGCARSLPWPGGQRLQGRRLNARDLRPCGGWATAESAAMWCGRRRAATPQRLILMGAFVGWPASSPSTNVLPAQRQFPWVTQLVRPGGQRSRATLLTASCRRGSVFESSLSAASNVARIDSLARRCRRLLDPADHLDLGRRLPADAWKLIEVRAVPQGSSPSPAPARMYTLSRCSARWIGQESVQRLKRCRTPPDQGGRPRSPCAS